VSANFKVSLLIESGDNVNSSQEDLRVTVWAVGVSKVGLILIQNCFFIGLRVDITNFMEGDNTVRVEVEVVELSLKLVKVSLWLILSEEVEPLVNCDLLVSISINELKSLLILNGLFTKSWAE
jgi:hypothetical protein